MGDIDAKILYKTIDYIASIKLSVYGLLKDSVDLMVHAVYFCRAK